MIKIGVFDLEGNPIDKPKVIVYDSLHQFVKEEVVNKTDFKGQIKKIEIQNFGTYYLQFSKEGYEPIEEVRVTWKNDMVNRSPIVKMKLLNASKSLSWMWWGIGAVMLLMALQGYKIFRKIVKTHEYNYEINVLVKLFRRSLRVSKGPTTFSNR
ncbi:MAG: hypothetical protein V8R91_14050 [Butyricimonas faecihominis]